MGGNSEKNPIRVETNYIPIPRDLYDIYKFVTLTADVMFVNSMEFLTNLSRDIIFFTAKHLPSLTYNNLSSSLIKKTKLYGRGNFIVHVIQTDIEFQKVTDKVNVV